MNKLPMANKKDILKEITLPADATIYIQKLNYEMEGYKAIIKTLMISTGEYVYNRDIYSYHMEKFQEAHSAFKIGMNMIVELYAPEFIGDSTVDTTVDFIRSTATFYRTNKLV